MNRYSHAFLFAACTLSAAFSYLPARADVTPASPFTDHMVLQRGVSTPVFGFASPGESVLVTLAGQTQKTVTAPDGKWSVPLRNLKAGGPFVLTLKGNNRVTLTDVYVGEVWLCSGQSNMDFTVAKTDKYYFAGAQNEAAEVAAANYPTIRMFKGDWKMAATPQATAPGVWKVCTPENVREFSAIGYFFARDLQKALNVPVGIIAQTYGASTAEAWIPREALQTIPEMVPTLAAFDAQVQAYGNTQAAQPADDATTAATGQPAPRARRNADPAQNQHNPTVLYNGMIAGIVPYGIKGVLWYQGESVLGGAAGTALYPKVQAKLVNTWRALWGNPNLPFYICQLAAYSKTKPEMRAAQATILSLPHTGMAVTIDIGDETNVHPKDKQDVGDRLTRIALNDAYGQKDIEPSGPIFQAFAMNGNGHSASLSFNHLGGGLVAKGSPTGDLNTFEVAGTDGKFVPATAKIDGNTVVVTAPVGVTINAVRYAWQNFPVNPNLYNKTGLPAAPFFLDTVHPRQIQLLGTAQGAIQPGQFKINY